MPQNHHMEKKKPTATDNKVNKKAAKRAGEDEPEGSELGPSCSRRGTGRAGGGDVDGQLLAALTVSADGANEVEVAGGGEGDLGWALGYGVAYGAIFVTTVI